MGKLTIQEIAKVLVTKNSLASRDANRFATEMFSVILQRLQQGEQVKIRGLGTFKIIDVDARESVSVRTGERVLIEGHSKVSFTPDNTMKELVNKPFSQFETVLLNDGVEFEDLKDDVTEEELMAMENLNVQPAVEHVIAQKPVEDPVVVPPIKSPIIEPSTLPPANAVFPSASSIIEPPTVAPTAEQPIDPIVEEKQPVEESQHEMASQSVSATESDEIGDVDYDDEPEVNDGSSQSWGKWLLGMLTALALIGASAYGGYYYGSRQRPNPALADTIFVTDTVYMSSEAIDEIDDESEFVNEDVVADGSAVVPDPIEQEQIKTTIDESAADPYSQKDQRVRLGAYRIIGLDHEVKVLEGQTFYSICRAHLGPDMECYVEVYNDLPRNPSVKAGQIIKIPKLQLKKHRQ